MMPRTLLLAVLLVAGLAGCSQDRVLLLPGDDGRASSGAVAVLSDKGETRAVIDRAYADASVGSDSVEQNITDAATAEKNYGALIEALPPPPLSLVLYFTTGTTVLTEKSRPELDRLFAEVKARPGADVLLLAVRR